MLFFPYALANSSCCFKRLGLFMACLIALLSAGKLCPDWLGTSCLMETRPAVGPRVSGLFDLLTVALTSLMERGLTHRALLGYLSQCSQTPAIMPDPGGFLWLRLAVDRGQPPWGLWMPLNFLRQQLGRNFLARLMEIPKRPPHASRRPALQERSSDVVSANMDPKPGTWVTETWPIDSSGWKAEKPSLYISLWGFCFTFLFLSIYFFIQTSPGTFLAAFVSPPKKLCYRSQLINS